ncbi:MAG: ParB/RepB/Spo0J family partition protein [Calditrichaceae bacterium]
MDFKIEFPAANTISNDNRFDLNSPFNFEVLQKSIKNFGFIHPLIAWRNENKIILVDGFKRLKIAKKLNKYELPFTFLSDQYSLPNVVDFRYENLCLNSIEMNIFQKAGLFNIIKNGNCRFVIFKDR